MAGDNSANDGLAARRLTRRKIVGGLALTASAASLSGIANTAHAVTSDANERVRAVLASLVGDTHEIGLQVAAYLDGELVIDAWAGMADPAAGRPVDGDTLFMLSSTTKGVTATCLHLCVEKHGLSYDMPIVQGVAGVRRARQAGRDTADGPRPSDRRTADPGWLQARMAARLGRMCRGIADLAPMFPIGERTGTTR